MADLIIAEATRQKAVTGKTHTDEDRAFQRWNEYIASIGIEYDPFLDTFTRHQRNTLIGAFAIAVRLGRFSGQSYDTLAAGTVSNTILYLALTFKKNGRPNPSLEHPFIKAVQGIPQQRPSNKTTKSTPLCRAERNEQVKSHTNSNSNSPTRHCGLLFCHEVMQVPQGTPGKAT
jgi:hypothetical protein